MDGLFGIIILLAVLPAFWILQKFFLPAIKGLLGELMVRQSLKSYLPAPYYTILNNVTLKSNRGVDTVQIDHIVVSPYGIFVIETRHMPGRVCGSKTDAEWTQTFYRSKFRFPNPLRQNHLHIKALSELLGLSPSLFHSLVIYTGSAKLETPMPVNVTMLGGLLPYIQVRTKQLIDYDKAEHLARMIQVCRVTPAAARRSARIPSLMTRHRTVKGLILRN